VESHARRSRPSDRRYRAGAGRGKTTSRKLVEAALARIADAGGEGGRVFHQGARSRRAARRRRLGPAAKGRRGAVSAGGTARLDQDLFDIAGEVTTAGSKILRDAPPATADAVAVARLRAAGAVVIAAAT